MQSNRLQFEPYTNEYKRIIRQAWYQNDKPSMEKLLDLIPEDVNGRKPNPDVIFRWRKAEGWDLWAEDLDMKALANMGENLILIKSEMLQRQAELGKQLQLKGMEFLVSGTFDSSASAVTAIIKGAELERTSRGIGEMLVKMATMDNSALTAEIKKLVDRASDSGMAIDAEIVKGDTTEE